MDKLGYMPKITVDSTWPFPATAQEYKSHEFEFPVKKSVKKTVKVPKATTRKKPATKKTK